VIARIGRLLSFSNVIACLALFVALGGSVYAAQKISGKQIKKSSLPGNRLKPKTVPANRIKPNSLSGAQINEGTLVGVSASALAGVHYQATTITLPNNGRVATATANCPPGAYAIGGGATLSNSERGTVNEDGPSPLRTGWTASGYGWYGPGVEMTVTAVCVVVQKPGGAVDTVPYQPAPPVQYQSGS
jgi:hypothetical protein